MKSYNHLWEKVITPENIKLAIHNAAKGKHKRTRVEQMLKDPDAYVPYYQNMAAKYVHTNGHVT